jgi:HK97 family phage major capsid protein
MKNNKGENKSMKISNVRRPAEQIKSQADCGVISGYASIFNEVDGYNDVVLKGAFAKSVNDFKSGKKPKLLWQHDTNIPIGVIEDLYEDNYGLFIKSRLLLEIPKAQEIYALLKGKAIDGFSIGYKIQDGYYNGNIQYLTDVELLEVSIVTFPACEKAQVEKVKSNNNERKTTMNKEIQSAIAELNNDINNFIATNDEQLNEMNSKMMKKEMPTPLPLSKNLETDAYRKSEFSEYIRSGADVVFRKSLSDKTGTEGGHLVPEKITLHINNKMKFLSPMRSIAKIITISTNSIDIIVDSKEPNVGWIAADEQRSETNSPEIQKIKIPVHEIYANPKASQRLLDDTRINVEEWLINKIAEKIAATENNAFVNGDGSGKPRGFLTYDSEEASEREFGKLQRFRSGADGKFKDNESAIDTLVDIVYSLKPIYMKNAKWVMSRSAIAEIRKLRNKDGVALWQPSASELAPATLLGYPVVVDDDMPALKEGEKSISVAFGDFYSGYQIVDRHELKILRDPYTSKPFVEFYAAKRVGGAVIDFDAIKLLKFEQ